MAKTAFLSIAVGLLVFTDLSGRQTAVGADGETLRRRVDALVQPFLDAKIVGGMTIGVLHDGKSEVFGYGRLSRDDQRVPDGDTIYEIGSMTKLLTGTLLAEAVVDGQVKLDQPAGELLPAGVKMPANGDRAITLQDLSTHVSGLPRLPDNMKFGDPDNPYVDYREADLYAFLNNYKLPRAPGTKQEYSNLGQGLLGHLLALQAKSTYEDLVRNRIAEPLKMSSTKITIDKESQSRFAPGHKSGGAPAAHWDLSVLAGCGGIRSTVNDLLLFATANLAPPKDKLGEAIEMAWTIHQEPIEMHDPALGLAWHVRADGIHWHNGQTGGYHSMILVDRKTKSSVVLLTNTAAGEVDKLAVDISRMMSGAKVTPRKFDKPLEVPAETMQKFVGSFELPQGAVFTVEVVDGKLMIALTGQASYQVFPRSETVWAYKVVDATITFNLDKDGKCDSLVLFQNGINQRAKRKAAKESPKAIDVPAESLKKLVGSYELAPGAVFTVEAIGGQLTVALTGQPALQIFPSSETEWFCKVVDAKITFNLDKEGKSDSLTLFQNGVNQTAKRSSAKESPKAIDVPAEALKKYVGSYELAPGAVFTVEAVGDKLTVALTGQPALQIFPRSETEWFCKEVDATITFHAGKNGKYDSLVLFQNGVNQTAKRKPTKPSPKAIDVPAAALEKYVGSYELASGAEFTVEAKDGKLMVALTGQPALQVFARSEKVWFYKEVAATITFVVDKSGKCTSLVLFQNGVRQAAKRKT